MAEAIRVKEQKRSVHIYSFRKSQTIARTFFSRISMISIILFPLAIFSPFFWFFMLILINFLF